MNAKAGKQTIENQLNLFGASNKTTEVISAYATLEGIAFSECRCACGKLITVNDEYLQGNDKTKCVHEHPDFEASKVYTRHKQRQGNADGSRVKSVHLYMAQDPFGNIKIGRSGDSISRLRELQIGNPFPLTLMRVWEYLGHLETKIHKVLKNTPGLHKRSEWFNNVTVDMVTIIATNLENGTLTEASMKKYEKRVVVALR